MYILTKEFKFEASHQLPHHDGKCARLHGHSWRGKITVAGGTLALLDSKQGMLIDYGDLGKALEPLVSNYLDHYHLNNTLEMESPTSELIAKWIYDKLKPNLPSLQSVEIMETCTTSCRYMGAAPFGSELAASLAGPGHPKLEHFCPGTSSE